jgi:hypothetical protein
MKKNLTLLVLFASIVLLLIAVSNRGAAPQHAILKNAAVAPKASDPAAPPQQPADTHALPVSFRPLNFALLRGGFTSADEFFERVHSDPVLSSFYGACPEQNAAIMKPLTEDILVFSTFRRGNEIKWARNPLLVHKGEYVLTFCGKTVLARCANLISWTPMQPSEDVPPSLLEVPTEVLNNPPTAVPVTTETHPAPSILAADATPGPASSSHRFFFVPPVYVPPSSGHSVAPPLPHAVGIEGDEFSGHQALLTLLLGFSVIGILKLVTR